MSGFFVRVCLGVAVSWEAAGGGGGGHHILVLAAGAGGWWSVGEEGAGTWVSCACVCWGLAGGRHGPSCSLLPAARRRSPHAARGTRGRGRAGAHAAARALTLPGARCQPPRCPPPATACARRRRAASRRGPPRRRRPRRRRRRRRSTARKTSRARAAARRAPPLLRRALLRRARGRRLARGARAARRTGRLEARGRAAGRGPGRGGRSLGLGRVGSAARRAGTGASVGRGEGGPDWPRWARAGWKRVNCYQGSHATSAARGRPRRRRGARGRPAGGCGRVGSSAAHSGGHIRGGPPAGRAWRRKHRRAGARTSACGKVCRGERRRGRGGGCAGAGASVVGLVASIWDVGHAQAVARSRARRAPRRPHPGPAKDRHERCYCLSFKLVAAPAGAGPRGPQLERTICARGLYVWGGARHTVEVGGTKSYAANDPKRTRAAEKGARTRLWRDRARGRQRAPTTANPRLLAGDPAAAGLLYLWLLKKLGAVGCHGSHAVARGMGCAASGSAQCRCPLLPLLLPGSRLQHCFSTWIMCLGELYV